MKRLKNLTQLSSISFAGLKLILKWMHSLMQACKATLKIFKFNILNEAFSHKIPKYSNIQLRFSRVASIYMLCKIDVKNMFLK
jgi:hypothetical protein